MSASSQNILDAAAAQIKPIVDGLVKFFTGLDNEVVNNGVVDIPTLTNLVTSAQTQVDTVSAGITASAAAAAADAASAAIARDSALLSRGIFASTAKALSNGVSSINSLVGGSGGTDGTYALAFSGGAGSGAAGTFTVSGGAVVQTNLTYAGDSYTSAPTISFAACTGLTGASATAVISANAPASTYFSVPVSGSTDALILYQNVSGTATEITRYPASAALTMNTGKLNGWPDPFFRKFDLTSRILFGKDRWYDNSNTAGFTAYTRPANAIFDGYALRRAADLGTTKLSGPAIQISDLGAVTGDTITVYALIVGAGAVVNMPAYFKPDGDPSTTIGAQQNPVNGTGGATVTSSATPQWLRISAAVPATATRLCLAPYTNTAGQTFDIVAVWAFKGAPSAGPTWPTLSEAPTAQNYAGTLDTRISTIETATVPAVDFIAESETLVTASATSTLLAATGVSSFPRDLVFTGWGHRFTPAGISFNAINIGLLSRTAALTSSRWKTLKLVVRTGANSNAAGATVVAVGSITVPPSHDSLTNLTFVLKDPTTGAVITLSDGSFSGGEYFIAVYALNSAGAPAACGEPRGTLSNSLGNEYYITSSGGDPKTSAFSAVNPAPGVPLGFNHQMLTSPVESLTFSASLQFSESLPVPQAIPAVVTPPYIFGIVGRECNLYLDNICMDDVTRYNANVDSTGAVQADQQQQAERWTWNPSAALTAGTVSVALADKNSGTLLTSNTLQVRAAAAAAGSGLTKKVMVIGDSLINAGVITQTFLDDNSIDLMQISLVGTQGTGPNYHEGRAGWTINDYTTSGRVFYSFTVSGVTTNPSIKAQYTHNGSTYQVESISISGGSGNINCSVVSGGAPLSSGTLTKISGTGDATIAFSASATAPGNPFWIGGTINYPQFLTNNGLAVPDWAMIALGINDIFGQTDDSAASTFADAAFTQLDGLIASIKTANTGINVGLMIPTPPSYSQDAFGANYNTGQTRWRYKRNILIWARQLIAKYAGQEASRIYLVPSNLALDTVNNMNVGASAPVNSRSTINVARQNNGVHPATAGYQQIADAVRAFIKYYA